MTTFSKQEYYGGGMSFEFTSSGELFEIHRGNRKLIQRFTMSASFGSPPIVQLPDARTVPLKGAMIYAIYNDGTGGMQIHNGASASFGTFYPGAFIFYHLIDNTTEAGIWVLDVRSASKGPVE